MRNGIVSIIFAANITISESWGSYRIATLPTSMCPSNWTCSAATAQNNTGSSLILEVNTDGTVNIVAKGGNALGSNWVFSNCSYAASA